MGHAPIASVVAVSGLEIRFQHRFHAFDLDVDVHAPAKGITALFGHSGAGKSSVIRAAAGLFRPQNGRLRFDDHTLSDTQTGKWLPPSARPFGCAFQSPLLLPHLTVEQNCKYGGVRRAPVLNVQEFATVYRLLGLPPLLNRYPRHLSGGEQQRVSLARAILSQPKMLLLDEPLSAVDETRRREVLAFLMQLRHDATLPILYVSHAMDEVARFADHVIVLENGRVVDQGSTRAVLGGGSSTVGRDGGAVVHGIIARHLPDEKLSIVAFDGGELSVPLTDGAVGSAQRLLIKADDVMVSTEPVESISANNVLRATVEALEPCSDGSVRIDLLCGMTALQARVTSSSVRRLGIEAGAMVFAIFKAERLRSEF
ncbi:MAG: molybdenum ABC transporter ATP-binding protein [Gammaproteobacteria bacterium]